MVSTAVGVALGRCARPPCSIGDVALLHDTNGLLGLAARGVDLCIVVVDNDGGGIFSFLPQAAALEPERFELLFGTPHGVDLAALAVAHGLPVIEAMDDESVEVAVRAALAAGGVHVVLARTDRAANVALHEQLHAATDGGDRRRPRRLASAPSARSAAPGGPRPVPPGPAPARRTRPGRGRGRPTPAR